MILSLANIRKTKNYFKKNGLKDTAWALFERVYEKKKNPYVYEEPSEEELEKQRNAVWKYMPKISLVVPAFETKPIFMEDLILSVAEQTYPNYELIIADASETDVVEKNVRCLMQEFDNIVYHRLSGNHGISQNTNEALALACGDYIGLLDHDDLLTRDALYETAKIIAEKHDEGVEPILVFSDEDKTNTYLEYYYEPNRKKGFYPEMLLTNNYVCHFSVFRQDIIKELQLREEYDGAQDYDLILRTVQRAKQSGGDWEKFICHIPKVLYHWRCHEASTAENPAAKQYAYEAGKSAVEDYLRRQGISVNVKHLKHLGFYRVEYGEKIFDLRKEIGVVGGPIYGRKRDLPGGQNPVCNLPALVGKRIVGGAMDGKGRLLFGGLPVEFSGVLHRAALQQEVPAVDIRNIQVREDLIPLFEKEVGISYHRRKEILSGIKSKKELEKIRKKSLIFCNKVRKQNIVVLYDPQLQIFEKA